MKITNLQAVIFDLGGVIINLNYENTIQAFKNLGVTDFREIYSQAQQTQLFDDYETGQISSAHFINKLLELLPKGTTPNKVVHAWNAMILDVPLKKIELLISVRKNIPIYLLSNTNDLHMEVVRRQWYKSSQLPIDAFFNEVFLSHEIKMRKPNLEIFDFVCSKHQLIPGNTLFIDDTLQHIEGAQKYGLQTLHAVNDEVIYEVFS